MKKRTVVILIWSSLTLLAIIGNILEDRRLDKMEKKILVLETKIDRCK